MSESPEVTAVEIARLAGVGRAAVSNWRRRHPDFPQPVGGTEASPTFPLDRVESWLRGQGKIVELPLLERVWQQLEALRDPAGHPAALLLPAGAFLLLLHRAPERWNALEREPDTRLALALPQALAELSTATLGPPGTALLALPTLYGSTQLELARLLARLAAEHGAAAGYEQLLTRYAEANSRQVSPTPPDAAALLAALAAAEPHLHGELRSVLDPACGLGALLLALPTDVVRHGQELDPVPAAAALLRLALHTPAATPGPLPLHLAPGDSLRADAHPGLLADAVLCQPPYNERDWGHDELRYDSRWLLDQVPPRAESELAWLLHCLAHTRPGGLTALLLPPTVASRRAGRRLRAELLRSGALRAVVALPAGVAPPYGVPLHLWLLRRPDPQEPTAVPRRLLLLDATATQPAAAATGGRDRIGWPELRRTVLETWHAFDGAARTGGPAPADRPGVHRVLDVIDLLDDETDLSPARHLPPAAPIGGAGALEHLHGRLAEVLAGLAGLDEALPPVVEPAERTAAPMITIGELVRAGALEVHSSGQGPAVTRSAADGGPGAAVLTEQDLTAGHAPTQLTDASADLVLTRPGDVLTPALGAGAAVVVRAGDPADGVALGRQLHLLRPDPAVLDAEFVAGRLRSTAGSRRASSHASTTARLDVRRVQLPRLPIERQRELGEAFRRVAAFETELRRAGELGRRLAQGLTDGLAEGDLTPR
ncbi:N-6 DNA methylase [Kitasatospora mediocidica]|uniref:N-6 DNA methylase n=1 Tax=Kitasatospora mediocidica TaxID=58352 RepID=UPI00055CAF22|nr:N-6 DNA methylase [Kitasatospora mediocidica]